MSVTSMPSLLQLPGGQARALEVRPCLVGEDGHPLAGFDGGADHAEGGAVAAGGESAGIAVGEDRGLRAEELGAVCARCGDWRRRPR